MKHALVAFVGAAVILGAAGCGTSSTTNQTATVTATPTTTSASAQATPAPVSPTAPAPATASSAPLAEAPTREPCALLTPELAAAFAGDDAERQSSMDSNPPLPVEHTACFYKGSAGSVYFSISPLTSDPTAPVNHFHVIRPENRIADVAYEAYWFAAGGSVVVVKDGLLLEFKVSDNSAQDDKGADVELANQIVPKVG